MAYADPTVTLAASPASPAAGVPFTVVATLTSSGTVGVKLRRATCWRLSGPEAKIGEFFFPEGTAGVPKFAGTNKPSTADYLANAGGSATSIIRFPAWASPAGTLALQVEVVLTRDDTGAEVRVLTNSTNVTIA